METENSAAPVDWQEAINETYQDVSRQVIEYAPQLLGAILLLAIGWLIAHLLRLATRKLVQGLDSIFLKVSRQDSARQEKLKQSYAVILGQIVFWAVLLFFVAASANLLGWEMFTGWMEGVVSFLPSLVTGLLIILAGFLISNAVRTTILYTSVSQAPILARISQIIILVSAVIIGIELIGLSMYFLTTAIIVVVGILLAGAALAFGLGAKTLVANIVGIQYLKKQYRIGNRLEIGNQLGDILEITQTNVILDTEQGKAVVPGKWFHENVSIQRDAIETTDSQVQGEEVPHG